MFRVWYAAINRAHSSTLRLLMETGTFCALIGSDVVSIFRNGGKTLVGIHFGAINQHYFSLNRGSVGNSPLCPTLINGIIGAFGLAGATVNTFLSNLYGHWFSLIVLRTKIRKVNLK